MATFVHYMVIMKILHVSGARGWGGNEQQLIDYIPELEKLGTEHTVFGVTNSILHNRCKELGINFIENKKKKLNKFANYLYLKDVVKKVKPDVIHLHTSDSLTVYTISDLLTGLKTKAVFSKKGMGSRSSLLSKYKYNYKNVAATICVSQRVQEEFSAILTEATKKKTIVIHDCVSPDILNNTNDAEDVRAKFNIPDNTFIIGNIANHTAAKDHFTLIDTADHLINTMGRKDVAFVQVGEYTKLTEELKELIKQKGLENHIFFMGRIAGAYRFNPQFDAFVMTSQREGGPTSVLEAMLLGVPVVTTNVGVVPEVITSGTNGFICPVKDYKCLAESLSKLMDDAQLRENFSELGSSAIKKGFMAPILAPQTLDVYKKAMQ